MLPIAFVIAAVYALSLPNYYVCTVKLSPELSSSRTSANSLLSLASSFGFNLGTGTAGMGTEALFPTLYPELINSTDFKITLFQVPVTIEGDKEKGEQDRTMSYYDYLDKEQKTSWVFEALGAPGKLIGSLFGTKKKEVKEVNPFRLTKRQAKIAKAIEKNVDCDVDKKTMVITIKVTDQDPVIAATMADSVKTRLQAFITDYRTSKVRNDLTYNKKIYSEAKARYERARDNYTRYSDTHRELSSQTALTKQSDLLNEMQVQQQLFQQVVAQVQQAEMKVQQETPAFTTLQSATVPVKKAGPKRAQMCIVFLFLAFIGTTAWILNRNASLFLGIAKNCEKTKKMRKMKQ